MNTTPAEIIKTVVPALREIEPTPEHADFEFNVLPDGSLAAFNDIEFVKVSVRVPIALDQAAPMPVKKTAK